MEQFLTLTGVTFAITTLITAYFFYRAAGNSGIVLGVMATILLLQGVLGASGFYSDFSTTPPRFTWLLIPGLIVIALLFILPKGRTFIDSLDLKFLTWLHVVRIPVELVLFGLYIQGTVPKIMTFEGRNLDILSGITAIAAGLYVYVYKKGNRRLLLVWNLLCLGLLLNIVTIAILSLPTGFQQLAFEQPNTGLAAFPYVWLPCLVVPLVLLAHLAAIRQLLRNSNSAVVMQG